MKGKLFTLCSALSLLLFVAVGVLWALSYRTGRSVRYAYRPAPERARWVDLSCFGGRFLLSVGGVDFIDPAEMAPPPARWSYHSWSYTRGGPSSEHYWQLQWRARTWGAPGLWSYTETIRDRFGRRTQRERVLVVRPAVPLAALAVLPSLWLWRRRLAAGRRRAGRCAACGYDLRATPERCPECGASPAMPRAAADRR